MTARAPHSWLPFLPESPAGPPLAPWAGARQTLAGVASTALVVLSLAACGGRGEPPPEPGQELGDGGAANPRRSARPRLRQASTPGAEPVRWDGRTSLRVLGKDHVWVFQGGQRWPLPAAKAQQEGFTVIDLGDAWTPVLLSELQPGDAAPKPLPYRQRYLDLANDRTDNHGKPLGRGQHNYLELYGIPPTPSVIRKRFLDARLRRCLEGVDREALQTMPAGVSAWGFRYPSRQAQALRDAARRLVRRHRLKGREELPRIRGGKRLHAQLERAERRERAVRSALKVLRCEGMLKGRKAWPPGDEIWQALTAYERKHMILGRGVLTKELAKEMARGADDADADAFRRVLRERVVHAARILEDGSARKVQKTYRGPGGRELPLPNLVRDFQRAALASLGLTSAAAIRQFLTALPAPGLAGLKVAVRLPPKPAYYEGREMDLEVIISRGDVYYDPPIDENGKPRGQHRSRLPSNTLWLTWQGQRIPLVRWRTTVGGWNDELKDGQVYLRYKPSKVGPRVWRDIVAAPVWIPPPTTPPKEIVSGKKVKTDQMGPGHLSAYGLVAALHLWPQTRGAEVTYVDQGIRSHGSYNYRSIRAGYSHGCHRLYNHLAIRLFSFILRHRAHERVGLEPYPYLHRFEYKGRKYKIKVENRGYIYRLTRPIAVTVTRGRVLGQLKRPLAEYLPKPGVVYHADGGVPEDSGVPADGGAPAPASGPGGNVDADAGVRPMPPPRAAPPPPGPAPATRP